MIVSNAKVEKIKNLSIDLYRKVSNTSTFIKIKTLFTDKYLFITVMVTLVGMNLFSLSAENFWKEYFLTFGMLIPISITVTWLMRRLIPSLNTRFLYCLLLIIIAPHYSINVIAISAYALFSLAIPLLSKPKLRLLALALIFISAMLESTVALLLLPYLIIHLLEKNIDYPALNIRLDKNFIIVTLFLIVIAHVANILIYDSLNYNFLSNIGHFFIYVCKLKTAAYIGLYTGFIMYTVNLHRQEKMTSQFKKRFLFVLIYSLLGILFLKEVFHLLASIFIIEWLVSNAKELWNGIISMNIKTKIKGLQVFALIVYLQRTLIMVFDFSTNSSFVLTSYYMSYFQFGFIQRGVLGTLFELILGTDIHEKEAVFFARFLRFFLLFLILISVWNFIKKSYNSVNGNIIAFLGCSFLLLPIQCLYPVDLVILLIGFLCIYLTIKNNLSVLLVPLLCFAAMSTHQVFASTVFPMVFSMLMYREFINSEKHTARNFIVLLTSFVVVAVSLAYYTYYNAESVPFTYEEVFDKINERSGGFFSVDDLLVKYVYLDKDHEHSKYFSNLIYPAQYYNSIKYLLLVSPIMYFYYYAYKQSIRKESATIKKLAYIAAAISFTVILPLFIRDVDFGRWCTSLAIIFTSMPALLLRMQPTEKQWSEEYLKNPKYVLPIVQILLFLFYQNYIDWELNNFPM